MPFTKNHILNPIRNAIPSILSICNFIEGLYSLGVCSLLIKI